MDSPRPVGGQIDRVSVVQAETPLVGRAERLRPQLEQCMRCGGRLKVIASIEEPELIERILAHRREWGEEAAPAVSLGARAPPQASLF